jgi:hydroxymethylglutaryl-CoA reductase (NADPH)
MAMTVEQKSATIPMRMIGPVRITGPVLEESVRVPLATLEAPLWPSTNRGARVSRACGGIRVVIADERMTRSTLFEAPNAQAAVRVRDALAARQADVAAVVAGTSRFGRLLTTQFQVVGRLLYVRLNMETGDAAGHNMVTHAADRFMDWALGEFPELRYVSISGNYCTDKKVSAVNGILGRGRYAIAELVVPGDVCGDILKATPTAVAELNMKKNLVGSIVAGSVRSANAHVANVLLAFYLATGQDAANLVEGSQAITMAEVLDGNLLVSVTLPSLILGTVGSGKSLPYVRESLDGLGCLAPRPAGENARRLTAICAATVLCGELSLLAAQTNRGELMRAHRAIERGGHE